MPRVKFDYVVSFSNEDPDHPASNLLETEVTKKKWLCTAGESSCSVVLGMSRAVKINSLQVCAHQAALVEVLVGRSESPSESFKVLVASSVFLSPRESRAAGGAGGAGGERVRSFPRDTLSEDTRNQRWDRVRVVCSQPYNKHCKYGLCFVHVFEAGEGGEGGAGSERAEALPLDVRSSDEEDSFKPGELFAAHLSQPQHSPGSTDSQIRQATSKVYKNLDQSAAQLVRTHVGREPAKAAPPPPAPAAPDASTSAATSGGETPTRQQRDRHKRVRTKEDNLTKLEPAGKRLCAGPRSSSPHRLLRDTVVVLSGYQNPRREKLRSLALAMGARYSQDWNPTCTHLVCAFPNTPKLRAVRAGPGGKDAVVVTGEWLERCSAERRNLPWQWFATEPARRVPEPKPDPEPRRRVAEPEPRRRVTEPEPRRPVTEPEDNSTDTEPEGTQIDDECDTDDEIQKVLNDKEGSSGGGDGGSKRRGLPALLAGRTLVLGADVERAGLSAPLLRRYVRAYGGDLAQAEALSEPGAVSAVLCAGAEAEGGAPAGVPRVRADWLWACHEKGQLLPYHHYLLPN